VRFSRREELAQSSDVRRVAYLITAAAIAAIAGNRPPDPGISWSAAGSDDGGSVPTVVRRVGDPRQTDSTALNEMLGRQQRWRKAPSLTVVESILEYQPGPRNEYEATADRLSSEDVESLVTDLTGALDELSDHAFPRFAAVQREVESRGDLVNVSRSGAIVVARYAGLRRQMATIGLGGRSARADGSITRGAIILDAEFDASNGTRRLLRTHELGHALGFDHVQAAVSIMNPRIGTALTEFDRRAVRIAFHALSSPPAH
jgi:hypothetical protein